MRKRKITNIVFRITALALVWAMIVPAYAWAEGEDVSFSTLAPQINIQAGAFQRFYSGYINQRLADQFLNPNEQAYPFLLDLGSPKLMFRIIGDVKRKIMEEGRLAIDDSFYEWFIRLMRQKIPGFNHGLYEQGADLVIDFFEDQEWPMEILTEEDNTPRPQAWFCDDPRRRADNAAKDISRVAFPVKDFSEAVFPGMKIFDFGIGHPLYHSTSWERKIRKHYKGIHVYGIDNDGLCLADMAADAVRNTINRWYRDKNGLVKSTIEYRKQSYLDPLPKSWGKADIITLNSPKPTQEYLTHVLNHDVAKAIYNNLKPGGIGFILTEWHMYSEDNKPVITQGQVARRAFKASLENVFGARNVAETEIPAGYFEQSLVAHILYAREKQKNGDFGLSFFQVRKAPEKDAFILLKRYTDVDRKEMNYSELPVVPMLIKALRKGKDIPAIHRKLSFELAKLLLVMFDMTDDPEMLGTIFHMNIFRNAHHYNEYKELMPVIGMAIAIAAQIDPAIKSYLMIPAHSFVAYNDIQRNMNRLAGFLRDEQIAIDFVNVLEEHKNDARELWNIDSQVAIVDALGAIFYKSAAIRGEVVERLNKLVTQESSPDIVRKHLQNTIRIIESGRENVAAESRYEQLMREFKTYASAASVNNNSLIRMLRDMELNIKQDDKGDFEKEAEEAYFADIKKYRDPIDDFDSHLARIHGSLANLDEHEVFFNQVLDLVRINYDQSLELLLGNKDAIKTNKGIKGFEPLPLIPARWDGETCLQFLRQFYELWADTSYDSNIYYDIDMRNLISPLEVFLAEDYDPSGVTQKLIGFLKTNKGIINAKNVNEFLKHIEAVLNLNEYTEINSSIEKLDSQNIEDDDIFSTPANGRRQKIYTMRFFSPRLRKMLKKMIHEAKGEIGCVVHPNSGAEIVGSADGYIAYLKEVIRFIRKADFPVFILVEADQIKTMKGWLRNFDFDATVVLIPTFYRNPQPFWGTGGILSALMPKEKRWEKAFGDLGIRKVVLLGEENEGMVIDEQGNIIKGWKRCVGAACRVFEDNLAFKVVTDARYLYPPPEVIETGNKNPEIVRQDNKKTDQEIINGFIQPLLDAVTISYGQKTKFRQCMLYDYPAANFYIKELIDNVVEHGMRRGVYLKKYSLKGWKLAKERAGGLVMPFVIGNIIINELEERGNVIQNRFADAIIQKKSSVFAITDIIKTLAAEKNWMI